MNLILKITKANRVKDFQFSINWENENFKFKNFIDNGIFDTLAIGLKDNEQGNLVIAGANESRGVSGEQELCSLEFDWIDSSLAENIEFSIKDKTGININDVEIPFNVTIENLTPDILEIACIWE